MVADGESLMIANVTAWSCVDMIKDAFLSLGVVTNPLGILLVAIRHLTFNQP